MMAAATQALGSAVTLGANSNPTFTSPSETETGREPQQAPLMPPVSARHGVILLIIAIALFTAACGSSVPPSTRGSSSSGPSAKSRLATVTPTSRPPTTGPATYQPTFFASAVASPSPSPSPSRSITVSLTPSSPPWPTSAPVQVAFTTPVPPTPTATWTGLRWQRVPADDPLSGVQRVVSWADGYVATGVPLADGSRSRTPVWLSGDGGTWRALDQSALGTDAIVIGMAQVSGGLVALTLHGGANLCGGGNLPYCWTTTGPLQAWRSIDGEHWTAQAGPALPLPVTGATPPSLAPVLFAAGSPGLLIVTNSGQVALAADGTTWQTLPADPFPSAFGVRSVAPFLSGFVVSGITAVGNAMRATAFWSTDGRHWVESILPGPGTATTPGNLLASASRGLIIQSGTAETPGLELWSLTTDGTTWRALPGFPPLGVWTGAGEGTGLLPNGVVAGDGTRMVAFRAGSSSAGWTSLDGHTWQRLKMSGDPPAWSGPGGGTLVILPMGVVWTDPDGLAWFGAAVVR